MQQANTHSSLLGTVIDIHDWLEADQTHEYEVRLERDRSISEKLPSAKNDVDYVLAWWSHIDHYDRHLGTKFDQARSLFSALLIVLGSITGVSVTTITLAYDGDFPVNILALLGVLVAIPTLLLVLTLTSRLLTGLGLARFGLVFSGTKKWLLGWLDRVAGTRLHRAIGAKSAYANVAYWLVVKLSQLFAIAFFTAALATFWLMLAFSDLAFGWSSTLDIKPATIFHATSWLSAPWQSLWPAAVPTLDMISATQYFKISDAPTAEAAPLLGQWWPFLIMCICVWGLLPRIVLWGLSEAFLARHVKRLLMDHAEITALLDRLSTPTLQHTGSSSAAATTAESPKKRDVPQHAKAYPLNWNGAKSGPEEFGVLVSPAEKQALLEKISADTDQVHLFAKSWEPPTLEVADAIKAIEAATGNTVVVILVGLPDQAVSASDLKVWQSAVAKLHASNVYVRPESQHDA